MLDLDNETIILNNPDASDEELEKIFAIKALVGNPAGVLQNVMGWEKFCFAVNNIIPNPEAVDIPNVLMIAHAVQEAEQVLNKKLLFNEPTEHMTIVYIATVAFDEGWVILPRILNFAQNELNKLTSDFAKHIFANITHEYLETTDPWDDDNPISTHCAKTQTCMHYLKVMKD